MQAIVATRAFGLGINKPNVRYVIRNGLPPSLSAWAHCKSLAELDVMAISHLPTFFTLIMTSPCWFLGTWYG